MRQSPKQSDANGCFTFSCMSPSCVFGAVPPTATCFSCIVRLNAFEVFVRGVGAMAAASTSELDKIPSLSEEKVPDARKTRFEVKKWCVTSREHGHVMLRFDFSARLSIVIRNAVALWSWGSCTYLFARLSIRRFVKLLINMACACCSRSCRHCGR